MEKNDILKNNQYEENISNDDYMQWLTEFINKYGDFDDIYFVHEKHHKLSEKDLIMINYLPYLHKELNKYAVKNNINDSIMSYSISYNNKIYIIEFNGEGYTCKKYEGNKEKINYIEHKDLKKVMKEICRTILNF